MHKKIFSLISSFLPLLQLAILERRVQTLIWKHLSLHAELTTFRISWKMQLTGLEGPFFFRIWNCPSSLNWKTVQGFPYRIFERIAFSICRRIRRQASLTYSVHEERKGISAHDMRQHDHLATFQSKKSFFLGSVRDRDPSKATSLDEGPLV